MLAHIYQYAQVAYVGGAFKQGLHNILEPAVCGVPIIFGPNTKGFPEAVEMLAEGYAFSVKNETELSQVLFDLFDEKMANERLGKKNLHYVTRKKGATEKIMRYIRTILTENSEKIHEKLE
jgi:3-deoxy-D-manno-octulosonic-acid transferase